MTDPRGREQPLPEVKITTVPLLAAEHCTICGDGLQWEADHPVPTAYTADSINDGSRLYEPVCDRCIEQHYPPALLEALLADRRRFYAG